VLEQDASEWFDDVYAGAIKGTSDNICRYCRMSPLSPDVPFIPLLALIHKVIAFYLENREEVDAYLAGYGAELARQEAASEP
jgi:hypothetical protein